MLPPLFAVLALAGAGPWFAPQEPPAPAPPSVPLVRAAARQGPIAVDGRLTEDAWRAALPAALPVQREPLEGAPALEPTEVRVLFDQGALYVAARLHETDPASVAAQLVRRDEWGQYDYFEVALDPDADRRTGYRFRVSAAGVQGDEYLFDDTEQDPDWDAVWQSAVSRDAEGWYAEIRIPLSQLRYAAADTAQSWGVNFARWRVSANELTEFALQSRLRHGQVSLFGQLEGLRLPSAARRIELRPYVVGSGRLAPSQPGDPFFDGDELTQRAGADLRYGLGSAFSLDATIAPDFGQVEVDPAVINLTAFETFFPEKRPFFVEDARIFDFALGEQEDMLFYSRRIGREPQGRTPEGAVFDRIPTSTSILGAAKLTGRTSSGLSVGGLAAVTRRETGRAVLEGDPAEVRFTAEPLTAYGVGRATQDFRDGATQIGGIVTALRRDLPAGGSLDLLTSDAFSGGLDFEHSWGGERSRDWAVLGFAAGSLVRGAPQAMLRIQRASNHYFQRPDATRLRVDSAAEALSGLNWSLQLQRRSARHWTGGIWLGEVTPGFEVNDLGFSTAGERLDAGAEVQYQEITPGPLFRSYNIFLVTFHSFRHEALDHPWSWSSWNRAHKEGGFHLNAEAEFANLWEADAELEYTPSFLSDVATRGGPLMREPTSRQAEISLSTDRRRWLSLEPSVSYEDRTQGGYRWEAGLEFNIRPSPGVNLELAPQWMRELNTAQYVASAPDPAFGSTFGRRYLFSDLRRQELAMETRVNVTLSPKLTFQLYAQPLLAAGDYLTYKQLATAESFDFQVFAEGAARQGPDGWTCLYGQTCKDPSGVRYLDFNRDGVPDFSFQDRNFNTRSLKVNAVLRWEYRPGSTLFLVWQQGREDQAGIGTPDLGRDLQALWDAPAENVFIVKLSHWLGL